VEVVAEVSAVVSELIEIGIADAVNCALGSRPQLDV
jgi:hypothetical protein